MFAEPRGAEHKTPDLEPLRYRLRLMEDNNHNRAMGNVLETKALRDAIKIAESLAAKVARLEGALNIARQSLTYITGHESVLDVAKTLHYAMHNSAKQALAEMAALGTKGGGRW